MFVELFDRGVVHKQRLARDFALGTPRPGIWQRGDVHVARFGHLDAVGLELPSAQVFAVRLDAHVVDAPAFQTSLCPRGRVAIGGAAGQARTVDVGQIAQRIHHLGMLIRLFLDPRDHLQVDLFLSEDVSRDQDGEDKQPDSRNLFHHLITISLGPQKGLKPRFQSGTSRERRS